MQNKKFLGVVYEGVPARGYSGFFGKTCNEVLTIGVLVLGFTALIFARHMTALEKRLKKIEQKLSG